MDAAVLLKSVPIMMAPQAIYFKLEDLSLKLYSSLPRGPALLQSGPCIV
jgi:hypothetical protein